MPCRGSKDTRFRIRLGTVFGFRIEKERKYSEHMWSNSKVLKKEGKCRKVWKTENCVLQTGTREPIIIF